jgi:restriction system protein
MDFKKTIGAIFNGVSEAVKNYATSDLPLAIKITLPVTLAAAAVVGGESIGIAGFGGAIGMPVLLLIFIGVAGITTILQSFLGSDNAGDYIAVVMSLIAKDEVLRRAKKEMQEAMMAEPAAPKKQQVSDDVLALKQQLLTMNPYDFEQHVMSFFQAQGLLAWVTKKSNDAGVDGFARHTNGLIVVQCKRNAETNPVGSPLVQQFKGVIEENQAWCGYIVTTSFFTTSAIESAGKSDKLKLVDMDRLLEWHKQSPKI